jgi:hypothetical protein
VTFEKDLHARERPTLLDMVKRFPKVEGVKRLILLAGLLAFDLAARAQGTAVLPGKFSLERAANAVILRHREGVEVARYQLTKPADTTLSVESGCYFHPFATPKGIVVTEVGPPDHPHHRGIFLAWVEMHGRKDADFWGWGEHAPKQDRRIVNRSITNVMTEGVNARFTALNEWLAEGDAVVKESLGVNLRSSAEANVLELAYTLVADADLTLAKWAFSGFCVRTRKDGELTTTGPAGAVALPNPSHLKPESDWPAEPWYDFTLRLPDGKVAGVAVINHPENPPSLWHNHRDVRMINPCVVAPGAVTLKAGRPLVLRYRVVAHDGAVPSEFLNRLSKAW